LTTTTKEKFIELFKKNYPNLKEQTAKRRFYDLRKKFGVQSGKFQQTEKKPLRLQKTIQLNDMKKYGIKINKDYLFKHGFTVYEINWLEDQGII